MPDLSLPWSGDLSLSPTGGVELISGSQLTRERLVRRLLTNPGDLLEDLTYGAGLARFIGRPVDAPAMQALIAEQAEQEATVSSVTSVTVTSDRIGSVTATVAYQEAGIPASQLLTLTVSSTGASYTYF